MLAKLEHFFRGQVDMLLPNEAIQLQFQIVLSLGFQLLRLAVNYTITTILLIYSSIPEQNARSGHVSQRVAETAAILI